jgi:hypothetical protein
MNAAVPGYIGLHSLFFIGHAIDRFYSARATLGGGLRI